ncbi:hypothetical protein SAMN05660443_2294 [Marinospirillum celere]|uniref:Uncharacterized protein n=1 Tax=Marinospirillum celere TaxID=1122252 RepID=A0A1I1I9N7_9GAMM|nr:hypothetical protein [Marinospirillum celere]SFC32917.1 hypothetical protein SAMN05660443_2294 [Marinospirillum celere]
MKLFPDAWSFDQALLVFKRRPLQELWHIQQKNQKNHSSRSLANQVLSRGRIG